MKTYIRLPPKLPILFPTKFLSYISTHKKRTTRTPRSKTRNQTQFNTPKPHYTRACDYIPIANSLPYARARNQINSNDNLPLRLGIIRFSIGCARIVCPRPPSSQCDVNAMIIEGWGFGSQECLYYTSRKSKIYRYTQYRKERFPSRNSFAIEKPYGHPYNNNPLSPVSRGAVFHAETPRTIRTPPNFFFLFVERSCKNTTRTRTREKKKLQEAFLLISLPLSLCLPFIGGFSSLPRVAAAAALSRQKNKF